MTDGPTNRISRPSAGWDDSGDARTQRAYQQSPSAAPPTSKIHGSNAPAPVGPQAWSQDGGDPGYYRESRDYYPAAEQPNWHPGPDAYSAPQSDAETASPSSWIRSAPTYLLIVAAVAVLTAGGGLAYTLTSSDHPAPTHPSVQPAPQQSHDIAPAPQAPAPPPAQDQPPAPDAPVSAPADSPGSAPDAGSGSAPDAGPAPAPAIVPAPALAPAQQPDLSQQLPNDQQQPVPNQFPDNQQFPNNQFPNNQQQPGHHHHPPNNQQNQQNQQNELPGQQQNQNQQPQNQQQNQQPQQNQNQNQQNQNGQQPKQNNQPQQPQNQQKKPESAEDTLCHPKPPPC